ncbi:hypothetical protein [Variovorax sp. V116]|uniref:hypothetical protein n=1 Tax=Variovorax sp. V116 TaxID=3065953 RepID=UPI0034E8C866
MTTYHQYASALRQFEGAVSHFMQRTDYSTIGFPEPGHEGRPELENTFLQMRQALVELERVFKIEAAG